MMGGGPSRRGLLLGGGALAGLALLPRRAWAAGPEHHVVIYWAGGGWDTTFVFDPHPDSSTIEGDPDATVSSLGDLQFADSAARPAVRAFFERWGSQSVIVNGLAVGSISHSRCTRLLMTGSASQGAPDLPSIVGATVGDALSMPSVVVSGPRYPGSLAAWSVPLSATLTGAVAGTLPSEAAYDPDREQVLRAFLGEQASGLAEAEGDPELERYRVGLERLDAAEALGADIQVAADASTEALMQAGVGALSAGLAAAMVVEGSTPPQSQWDTHVNSDKLQSENFEHAFGELETLLSLLDSAPAPLGGSLLSRTTVLVLSEMGRTPVHNGADGKDHWPFTSCLLVGAGIRGGRSLGLSDDLLVGQPIDLDSGAGSSSGALLAPTHLAAGLLQQLDVDPEPWFPGVPPFRAPFG